MGFADLWNRTLVYFGIAEEDDYWDEDGYATNEELERTYSRAPERAPAAAPRSRAGVRGVDAIRTRDRRAQRPGGRARATTRRLGTPARPAAAAPARGRRRARTSASTSSLPRSFNDAQQIADKFKEAVPVILNLQTTDGELSKRLIDFASGLTYALNGGMQRVADKVFLLTPRNVEVSAEERARLLERGGFFNQA